MTQAQVLEWAKKIVAKGSSAKPHDLLLVRSNATPAEASDAFMKLARFTHPDLFRNKIPKADFEMLELAYSRVAGAYQELRTGRARPAEPAVAAQAAAPAPVTGNPETDMNAKALGYFRKAEAAAERGDLRGAALQLKMAIAADPSAMMLKNALAQVEGELKKK